MHTKIIGIGSPFSDDNLGRVVITALQSITLPSSCELAYFDRPNYALLSALEEVDCAILVDAILSDKAAGSVHVFEGLDWPDSVSPISSHGLDLKACMTLGHSLRILPHTLFFMGIEAEKTDSSLTMSERVLTQVPVLIETILSKLPDKPSNGP